MTRESRYWLGVALNANYVDKGDAEWLQQESTELIAILQASQKTGRGKANTSR